MRLKTDLLPLFNVLVTHLPTGACQVTCVVPRRMDATVAERPRLRTGKRTPEQHPARFNIWQKQKLSCCWGNHVTLCNNTNVVVLLLYKLCKQTSCQPEKYFRALPRFIPLAA